MRTIYINKETGEVFRSYKAMLEDWREKYDGGDPTNPIPYTEYYNEEEAEA